MGARLWCFPKTAGKSAGYDRAIPFLRKLIRPRLRILAGGFLLMLVNRGLGLVVPVATKLFVDKVVSGGEYTFLTPIVLTVLGAGLIQGGTSFALTQLLSRESQRLIAELRCTVYEHVGRLPLEYYDKTRVGSLVSRIMTDVEAIRSVIGTGLIEVAGGIIASTLSVGYLLWISPPLTCSALLFLAAFGIGSRTAFARIRPIFRDRGSINAEVTGRLAESLSGVRVIKGYRAEDHEARVFSKGIERLLDSILRTVKATSSMSFGVAVLTTLSSATVMYIGAREISSAKMTLGDFMSFMALLATLGAPMYQVAAVGTQISEALASLDRTQQLLDLKPEGSEATRVYEISSIRGDVSFEAVRFSYVAGRSVLHDVCFEAKHGSVTAFVGTSGAGKSTIVSLIAGFHKPTSGIIRVDGMDLSTVSLESYRKQLGVVLQETFLFSATIRENVTFARPHATEEEMLSACRIARVDEFAERLEKKYETIVGERGVTLSGGERQRVSIARAILANPRILILDEATSNLDIESESAIQSGLAYLIRGRTTFIVAHRLSTIQRADQVIVVEDGRIIERGTHADLCAMKGRYYDLYQKQADQDGCATQQVN